MNTLKCWGVALTAILLLPNVASSADPAKEAYEKGNSSLDKQDYDAAISAFTEAIRLDPKDAHAYGNRGLAHWSKGDLDKAIADYDEAIRLNPQLAQAYSDRGLAYWKKGVFDKAISDCDEAIRLDPKLARAYNNRGNAYDDKGNLDRAIADYIDAIRLDPECALSYYNRAGAYRKKGEQDKAIADFTEAIRWNPRFAEAYCNRCVIFGSKGDYGKAIADGTEAVRLDPKNSFSRNNLAWFLATCPEERFRDGKRAVEHATRACELTEWKDWNCIATVAAAYAEAKAFDKAIEFQQKALKMATQDADKERCKNRLNLYQDGKPYREPVKKKVNSATSPFSP